MHQFDPFILNHHPVSRAYGTGLCQLGQDGHCGNFNFDPSDDSKESLLDSYPLVNIQKTMESHLFLLVNQLFQWPVSSSQTVCF